MCSFVSGCESWIFWPSNATNRKNCLRTSMKNNFIIGIISDSEVIGFRNCQKDELGSDTLLQSFTSEIDLKFYCKFCVVFSFLFFCRIFLALPHSMQQDLSFWPWMKPVHPAVEAGGLNHWTTREVLWLRTNIFIYSGIYCFVYVYVPCFI